MVESFARHTPGFVTKQITVVLAESLRCHRTAIEMHDYHNGRDFDDMSPDYVFRYKLEPATRDNIDQVQRIADPENWGSVDFRQFSRVGESETAKAVPDPDAVLDAITGALTRQETGSVASRL